MSQGSSSNCMSDRPTPPNDFKWPSFDQSAWKCFQITPSACKSFKSSARLWWRKCKALYVRAKRPIACLNAAPPQLPYSPITPSNDCKWLSGRLVNSVTKCLLQDSCNKAAFKEICCKYFDVVLHILTKCNLGRRLPRKQPWNELYPATFMSALSGKYGSQRGRDWYSLALFGMVWCDLVWFGMVWYGVFMPALSRK